MIKADLHTHTVYSHGKGTIEENYNIALEKGLTQLGISDHGLRHWAYGIKKRNIAIMRGEIERLNSLNKPCKLYYGIEANICGSEGEVDLTYSQTMLFDYVIAGYHKAARPVNFPDFFNYSMKGLLSYVFTENSISKTFTKAYIKAIESGKIDIISHLNLGVKVDVSEVGKAARDYGVLIELNGKGVAMTDDEVDTLNKIGVDFILSSDAHSPERVGDVSLPMQTALRVGIPEFRIVNINHELDMEAMKKRKSIKLSKYKN